MKHDYLKTSLWYKEKISDPYQVIAEFFTAADIVTYRKMIKDILMTASSDRAWKHKNAIDLLYYFKLFESAINAAYLLNKENKESPLVIDHDNAFNPNLYCGWHKDTPEWDYLPRVLSFKEYANPYLVFKRFFKYLNISQWKNELNCLWEHSLGNTSLHASGIELNVLSVYFHLCKLIEAAHLIDVREVNHISGRIKDKLILSRENNT